jgi:hypothetical protein
MTGIRNQTSNDLTYLCMHDAPVSWFIPNQTAMMETSRRLMERPAAEDSKGDQRVAQMMRNEMMPESPTSNRLDHVTAPLRQTATERN